MKLFLNHVWFLLRTDVKKGVIVCSVCALGLLIWGRLLLKDVPRSVTAEPEKVLQAVQPSERLQIDIRVDDEEEVDVTNDDDRSNRDDF
ncbi:hypothetical protein KS4_32810 [Poriferisphaera corsica]|uniref:Uncharacterized protein n=1 Tax=Poriferisphaera corsica TaxID=2528020 RepID=A0A517YY90_9BACT|nr:hypothetical protein [Poriferisphaera corsica]QDU35201.1 hypothetical protein KS4_32810 [Poriferisphaera corsica]